MRLFVTFLVLATMLFLTSCGEKTTETIPKVAKPYFSIDEGVYHSTLTVEILCETLGVTILYTTDGSDPNSSSMVYSAPIQVEETTILKAKAFRNGMLDSDTAIATYTLQIATYLEFYPPGGEYSDIIHVSIHGSTPPDATMRYTTDGTEPTENSQIYESPICVSKSMTIHAKVFKEGWVGSQTASASYLLPEIPLWSVFFISAGDDDITESHYVSVMWIGDSSEYVEPNSVSVIVDDIPVELIEYSENWMGETTVVPGQVYEVELIIDGISQCNVNLEIVYEADVTFPVEYDYTETASITWSLSNDNQTQIASIISFDNADFEEDSYDHELDPSTRDYLFPADVVDNFGDMTTFTLELSQINSVFSNPVNVISAQSEYKSYGFGYDKAISTPDELIKYCRRLLSHIN